MTDAKSPPASTPISTPASTPATTAPILRPFTLLDTTLRESAIWELGEKTIFLGLNQSYKSAPVQAARAAYLKTIRARDVRFATSVLDLAADPARGWRAELKGPSGEAIFVCPISGETMKPPLTGALAIGEATRSEACVTDIGDEILSGRSAKARALFVRGLANEIPASLCEPQALSKAQMALWEEVRMAARANLATANGASSFTEAEVLTELTELARKRQRAVKQSIEGFDKDIEQAQKSLGSVYAVSPEIANTLTRERTQYQTLLDAEPIAQRLLLIEDELARAEVSLSSESTLAFDLEFAKTTALLDDTKKEFAKRQAAVADALSADTTRLDLERRELTARIMRDVAKGGLASGVCPLCDSASVEHLEAKVEFLTQRQLERAAQLVEAKAEAKNALEALEVGRINLINAQGVADNALRIRTAITTQATQQASKLKVEQKSLIADARWRALLSLPPAFAEYMYITPEAPSTSSNGIVTNTNTNTNSNNVVMSANVNAKRKTQNRQVFLDRITELTAKIASAESALRHKSNFARASTQKKEAEGQLADWKVVVDVGTRTQISVMLASKARIIERIQAYLPPDLRVDCEFEVKKIEFGLIGKHGRLAKMGAFSGREEASLIIALGAWLSPSPFRIALPDDVGLGMFDAEQIFNYFSVLGAAVDNGRIHQIIGAWNRPHELTGLDKLGWKVHMRRALPNDALRL